MSKKSASSDSPKKVNADKKPQQLNTDTSLHLGLLADATKLKPSYEQNQQTNKAAILDLSLSPDSEEKKDDPKVDSDSSISSVKNSEKKPDNDTEYKRRSTRSPSPSRNSYNDLNDRERRLKKLAVYNELMRLKNVFGIQLMKEYTLDSDYDEMEEELDYHRNGRKRENGIEWGKKILLGCTWGLEWLNEKYDPFSFQLSGRNEHMNVEVKKNAEYHEVIGELYDKYALTGRKMEPEIKLLLLVCGSAAGFHMTKSLSKHMPGLEDALKNDPNLLGRLQDMVLNSLNGDPQQAKQQEQFAQQQELMKQYQQMQKMKQQMQPTSSLPQPFNNPIPKSNTAENINLKVNEMQQLYDPKPTNIMKGPPRDLLNKINQRSNIQLSDSGSDRVVYAQTVNTSDGDNSVKSKSSVKKRTRGPVIAING